ncbi:MAG: pyrroline-5-carboxylate reductase [Micrococcales bacterium]
MNIERIAILGSGSMGGAILAGLLASGFASDKITVSTKSEPSAQKHVSEYGIQAYSLESTSEANRRAVEGADVVILAVKPAYIVETLSEVANALQPGALVISVAAGVTNASMEAAVPGSVRVLRSMPNTPAIVGRAVTGLASGTRSTEEDLSKATALFETVGRVVVVDETQIDALSTISGSGPAYVFYFIEQLTNAALHHGFTVEQAATMVNDTFLGAAELIASTGRTPADLRRQVTSPNGTTERAIATFAAANLDRLFIEATEAALARARELAAGK